MGTPWILYGLDPRFRYPVPFRQVLGTVDTLVDVGSAQEERGGCQGYLPGCHMDPYMTLYGPI